MLYSGELGRVTVLAHGLHPNVTHGSKKSHKHCDGHTPVNSIELLAKLCEGSFLTQPMKGNSSRQPTRTNRLSANRQPVLPVDWWTGKLLREEKRRDNLNIRATKVTGKLIALFCIECHHELQLKQWGGSCDDSDVKCVSWINDECIYKVKPIFLYSSQWISDFIQSCIPLMILDLFAGLSFIWVAITWYSDRQVDIISSKTLIVLSLPINERDGTFHHQHLNTSDSTAATQHRQLNTIQHIYVITQLQDKSPPPYSARGQFIAGIEFIASNRR